MQHFYGNNYTSLCCDAKIVKSRIDQLTGDDLNEIKQLDSVAKYMQEFSKNERKSLDDHEFKVYRYARLFSRSLKWHFLFLLPPRTSF